MWWIIAVIRSATGRRRGEAGVRGSPRSDAPTWTGSTEEEGLLVLKGHLWRELQSELGQGASIEVFLVCVSAPSEPAEK